MTTPRRFAAVCAALSTAIALGSCGDDVVERPAHRPISVIYVAGDPAGPWAARTEGLADGVKLAIADRQGLMGERAVSIAVVPTLQRDGPSNLSASIGAGRIVRDSRAIAILGAYSAPEAAIAVPQFNGGELAFLQFGSGMEGLIRPEAPGEPGRYEVSGQRFELRVTPGDELVGKRAAAVSALRRAQVVPVTTTYRAQLAAAAAERAKAAAVARAEAKEDGDDPLPSTSPVLTDPSPEIADAERLAARIAEAVQGQVVRAAAIDPTKPTIVVTDPSEPDPTTAARSVLAKVRGAALVVDAADRSFDPAVMARGRGGEQTFQIRRSIAPDDTELAKRIRAQERKAFGRDRGAAVVAGYLTAQRILELGTKQPERTIDRVTFARALVAAAPGDPDLPSTAAGEARLGSVSVFALRGGSWMERPGVGQVGRDPELQFGVPRPGARPEAPTTP